MNQATQWLAFQEINFDKSTIAIDANVRWMS